MKVCLLLMKNVLQSLAKNVLITLGPTTSVSAADPGIHKKLFGLVTTTLVILFKEMEDIKKIVTFLKDFGFLVKDVSQIIQN